MVTLYLKTHNVTGLKYFGKFGENKRIDSVYDYMGSGKHWKRHLRKHGYDVSTEVIGVFQDLEEASQVALRYSHDHNIVESKEYANLKLEDARNGGSTPDVFTPEARHKMSVSAKGRSGPDTASHLNTPEIWAKMRKPKTLIYKDCQHCGESKKSFNVEKHEAVCYHNPVNYKECPVCQTMYPNLQGRKRTCSQKCANISTVRKRNASRLQE